MNFLDLIDVLHIYVHIYICIYIYTYIYLSQQWAEWCTVKSWSFFNLWGLGTGGRGSQRREVWHCWLCAIDDSIVHLCISLKNKHVPICTWVVWDIAYLSQYFLKNLRRFGTKIQVWQKAAPKGKSAKSATEVWSIEIHSSTAQHLKSNTARWMLPDEQVAMLKQTRSSRLNVGVFSRQMLIKILQFRLYEVCWWYQYVRHLVAKKIEGALEVFCDCRVWTSHCFPIKMWKKFCATWDAWKGDAFWVGSSDVATCLKPCKW